MERRAFLLLLGVLTATFAAVFAAMEPSRLVSFVADGAGYYLQLARNATSGHGVTFDGIHPTNGFHPLWLGVLLVVFGVVHGSSEALYRLVGLLDVGLLAVAALVFHGTLRRLLSPLAALAGGAVFAALAFLDVNLMETALVLLATTGLFAYAQRLHDGDESRILPSLGFGLLLGVCILARLDAGFLALGIGIVGVWQIARAEERRRSHAVRLASIVAGASLLVLPYLAYNRVVFGAILPVSGRLESGFPHVNVRGPAEALGMLGLVRATFWLAGVAYLPAYALWRRRAGSRATGPLRFFSGCVALLAAVGLAHSAHEMLFIRWQLPWHYWMLVPLGGGLAGVVSQRLLDQVRQPSSRRVILAGLGVVLLVLGWAMQRRVRNGTSDSWRGRLYDASVWIRDHVGPDARLAMRDAEITGFFGDRQVVDLIGLGNGLELQDVIRDGRLRGYLARSGVRYVAQMNFSEGVGGDRPDLLSEGYESVDLRFVSELYGTSSDPLRVRRVDEVYRSRPYVAGGRQRAVVVWRLGPSADAPSPLGEGR